MVVRRDQVSALLDDPDWAPADNFLSTRGHTAEEVGLLFDHLDGDVGIIDELFASKAEQAGKSDKVSLEHVEKLCGAKSVYTWDVLRGIRVYEERGLSGTEVHNVAKCSNRFRCGGFQLLSLGIPPARCSY